MIRAAVCDDEKQVRLDMERLLLAYPEEEIQVQVFASGEALLLSREQFDVIFLDIDMDGINGIATAKQLRLYDKQVKIIYLTNYRDYVGSAFAVHAFGYLLKPAESKRVFAQLSDVLDYRERKEAGRELEFETVEGRIHLCVRQILYFEYQNRSISIHTLKQEYRMKEKMADLAQRMAEEGFVVPHKSFCVNLYHVRRVKGYEIEMMNGDMLPLSQKKSVVFRQLLNEYAVKHI